MGALRHHRKKWRKWRIRKISYRCWTRWLISLNTDWVEQQWEKMKTHITGIANSCLVYVVHTEKKWQGSLDEGLYWMGQLFQEPNLSCVIKILAFIQSQNNKYLKRVWRTPINFFILPLKRRGKPCQLNVADKGRFGVSRSIFSWRLTAESNGRELNSFNFNNQLLKCQGLVSYRKDELKKQPKTISSLAKW